MMVPNMDELKRVPNMDELKRVENFSRFLVRPEFQEGADTLMKDSLQHT